MGSNYSQSRVAVNNRLVYAGGVRFASATEICRGACTHAPRHPGIQSPAMVHPLPRILSRRLCQLSSPTVRVSPSLPRSFQSQFRNSAARRGYATGESGPNPRPGQSPFKIWPFIAITLAGSGAYALMVRSRVGTCNFMGFNCFLAGAMAKLPFKSPNFAQSHSPTFNSEERIHSFT